MWPTGRCLVVASEGFTEWVLKEQGMAAEGMPSRNDYMYGENLEVSATGIVDTGLGQMIEGGEVTYIEPTDVIGTQGGAMVIDGVEIEFMFAPGEAPTGMHCYFPKHKLLHCADNCYMCLAQRLYHPWSLSSRCHAMGRQRGALTFVRGYRISCQWT